MELPCWQSGWSEWYFIFVMVNTLRHASKNTKFNIAVIHGLFLLPAPVLTRNLFCHPPSPKHRHTKFQRNRTVRGWITTVPRQISVASPSVAHQYPLSRLLADATRDSIISIRKHLIQVRTTQEMDTNEYRTCRRLISASTTKSMRSYHDYARD